MRTGVVTSPEDDNAKRELMLEAEFYGLVSLSRAIRAPALELSKHLGNDVLAERENESSIRAVFATGETSKISRLRPDEALVDFFATYPGGVTFAAPPPVDDASSLLFSAAGGSTAPLGREGAPASVSSLDRFEENFNTMYPNVLARLKPLIESRPRVGGFFS